MLEVEGLHVTVNGKEILKGINLAINKKETHALMGPNACGKTSLVLTILDYPSYQITEGRILFNGNDLTQKDISERAKLGIALAYQSPPEVRGVRLRDMLNFIADREPQHLSGEDAASYYLQKVGLEPASFSIRELNLGFSGGEKKRSELAQVFAMKPEFLILDEPDSGVDIDSLKLIGREIRGVTEELGSGVLVITHHRHILQYLKVDVCHIMYDGRIVVSGSPGKIIPLAEELGYEEYIKRLGA